MCQIQQKETNAPQINPKFWRQITDFFREDKISVSKKNFRNSEHSEASDRATDVYIFFEHKFNHFSHSNMLLILNLKGETT